MKYIHIHNYNNEQKLQNSSIHPKMGRKFQLYKDLKFLQK